MKDDIRERVTELHEQIEKAAAELQEVAFWYGLMEPLESHVLMSAWHNIHLCANIVDDVLKGKFDAHK